MNRATAIRAPYYFLAKSSDEAIILAVDGDRCEHVLEKKNHAHFLRETEVYYKVYYKF